MAKKNTNANPNPMIGNFMGTMMGVGLMGATAGIANNMPAGMAKDLTGTAVGLQGVALVGHSLGAIPNMSYGNAKSKKGNIKFI